MVGQSLLVLGHTDPVLNMHLAVVLVVAVVHCRRLGSAPNCLRRFSANLDIVSQVLHWLILCHHK